MARLFNPQISYRPELDVRAWDDLAALVAESAPHGLFWPLVGPRRSGKTWGLRAVEAALGGDARFVELRGVERLSRVKPGAARYLLVDEPGKFIFAAGEVGPGHPRRADPTSIAGFFAWCGKLRERGLGLLIAMTPAEWAALRGRGVARQEVSDKDLQPHLGPLALAQARRLAADDPAALALLDRLALRDPRWLRNPFVARHLLHVADRGGELDAIAAGAELGDDALAGLLQRAIEGARTPADYVAMVLYEGLDDDQQAALKAVARGEPERAARDAGDALGLLVAAGLVDRPADAAPRLGDPILAEHLPPPLRIHHISDVHVGPKSALRVNQAGVGPAADKLAQGSGQGELRESYLEHVGQRRAQGSGPHLVIVSGDLTETGRAEENEAALAFLAALRERLDAHPDVDPGAPPILLVGGNHDVDWMKTRGAAGARERHRRFAEAFAAYPRPRLEEPPHSRPLEVVTYASAGLAVVLLGSAEYGGEIDELLVGLVDRLAAEARAKGEAGEALAPELRRLGRLDPGLVHSADLHRLRARRWELEAPIRIAVLHHPVSPLPTITDVAPYAGLINAGAVKDALFDRRFALVLHGHQHAQWLGEERWPGHAASDHTLRIAAAPSLGSREVAEQHGYNEVLILREGDRHEVEVRTYTRSGDTWSRGPASLGPFAVE